MEKNVNFLSKEDFNSFFKNAVEVLLDAQKNPVKGKVMTLQKMLDDANMVLDIEPALLDEVNPNLAVNLYSPEMSSNGCPVCSVCALCAVCGEINGAAGLAGVTGIFGFWKNSSNSIPVVS
ncbi:MAG: hypothetical protein IJ057_04190 [Bacteroidales bacterium]|nr:hypothetical protein [Bacteroidales bacterium]